MDGNFFSFNESGPAFLKRDLDKPLKYLEGENDPRNNGGILIQRKSARHARCHVCDTRLSLDVFYFEGKTRNYVFCEKCDTYLFELKKKRKF
ncbi:MAG: hypothetical protein ACTSWN_10365 [Promethearchaeota archaeon]